MANGSFKKFPSTYRKEFLAGGGTLAAYNQGSQDRINGMTVVDLANRCIGNKAGGYALTTIGTYMRDRYGIDCTTGLTSNMHDIFNFSGAVIAESTHRNLYNWEVDYPTP